MADGPLFRAEVHVTESPCDSDFTEADIRAALLAQNVQLRRDRDELVAALRASVQRCNCDGFSPFDCEPCSKAKALLARVKGR